MENREPNERMIEKEREEEEVEWWMTKQSLKSFSSISISSFILMIHSILFCVLCTFTGTRQENCVRGRIERLAVMDQFAEEGTFISLSLTLSIPLPYPVIVYSYSLSFHTHSIRGNKRVICWKVITRSSPFPVKHIQRTFHPFFQNSWISEYREHKVHPEMKKGRVTFNILFLAEWLLFLLVLMGRRDEGEEKRNEFSRSKGKT